MSYRRPLTRPALGQAYVPGQINFMSSPTGRVPWIQRSIETGWPSPGIIEHGSYMTGQPDIVQFGYDPYRGIMGLGAIPTSIDAVTRVLPRRVLNSPQHRSWATRWRRKMMRQSGIR